MDERNTLSTTNKVHAPSFENILLIKWQQSLYNTHTHTHFCTKATRLGVRIQLMKTMRRGSINVCVCVCCCRLRVWGSAGEMLTGATQARRGWPRKQKKEVERQSDIFRYQDNDENSSERMSENDRDPCTLPTYHPIVIFLPYRCFPIFHTYFLWSTSQLYNRAVQSSRLICNWLG